MTFKIKVIINICEFESIIDNNNEMVMGGGMHDMYNMNMNVAFSYPRVYFG